MHQRHFQGDDWALLLETEEDPKAAVLTRRITTFRRVGRLYRRGDEVHRLRLYQGADLVLTLEGLGFRTRLQRCYGKFQLPPGLVAIMARKLR